jgi:hypothetical protein
MSAGLTTPSRAAIEDMRVHGCVDMAVAQQLLNRAALEKSRGEAVKE